MIASDFQQPRVWMAVLVNAKDKEGGCITQMKTVGFDAFWGNVGDVVDGPSSVAELGSNVMSIDVVGAAQ